MIGPENVLRPLSDTTKKAATLHEKIGNNSIRFSGFQSIAI
jgi:hypothetical protein